MSLSPVKTSKEEQEEILSGIISIAYDNIRRRPSFKKQNLFFGFPDLIAASICSLF